MGCIGIRETRGFRGFWGVLVWFKAKTKAPKRAVLSDLWDNMKPCFVLCTASTLASSDHSNSNHFNWLFWFSSSSSSLVLGDFHCTGQLKKLPSGSLPLLLCETRNDIRSTMFLFVREIFASVQPFGQEAQGPALASKPTLDRVRCRVAGS